MLKEFEAVYENGVLRPAQALALPEHTRLRVSIRSATIVPSPESQADGLQRLREISESGVFCMNGRRMTRDELHERD